MSTGWAIVLAVTPVVFFALGYFVRVCDEHIKHHRQEIR